MTDENAEELTQVVFPWTVNPKIERSDSLARMSEASSVLSKSMSSAKGTFRRSVSQMSGMTTELMHKARWNWRVSTKIADQAPELLLSRRNLRDDFRASVWVVIAKTTEEYLGNILSTGDFEILSRYMYWAFYEINLLPLKHLIWAAMCPQRYLLSMVSMDISAGVEESLSWFTCKESAEYILRYPYVFCDEWMDA